MTGGRVARIALAAWLAVLAAPVAPVAAATPSVGAPRISVTFLDNIRITAEAVLTAEVVHREVVLEIEGSDRSIVAEVGVPVSGPDTLIYDLPTPGGALMPSTTIRAHFRLTLEDGSRIVGPSRSVTYEDTRYDWTTLAGDFVIVHWTEGGADFGRRAVRIADDAVREASDLLGVTESEPIDFYVYGDRAAFYDVLGAASRENVGGQAHPELRALFANISPTAIDDPWVGEVIPHELAHVVFDTAVVNDYHYPPRWLNEGLAVYLSEGYAADRRALVEDAVDDATLMPLEALGDQFPTTAAQFFLAYGESVSAVQFLVDEHGQPAMVDLVRSYADGVTDDEAFERAIGTDVAGFEAAWLESLGAATPVPYGPVEAPAGPVPSDWIDEGEVPGPGPTGSPRATVRPGSPGPEGSGVPTALVGLLAIGAGALAGLAAWAVRRSRSSRAVIAGATAGASPPEPAGPSLWATRGGPPPTPPGPSAAAPEAALAPPPEPEPGPEPLSTSPGMAPDPVDDAAPDGRHP